MVVVMFDSPFQGFDHDFEYFFSVGFGKYGEKRKQGWEAEEENSSREQRVRS